MELGASRTWECMRWIASAASFGSSVIELGSTSFKLRATFSPHVDAGLGVGHLLKLLCGFLKQDMNAFSQRAESAVTVSKRIQFWLMLVNKLAVACPEACSAGWEVLLKWHVSARWTLSRWVTVQHDRVLSFTWWQLALVVSAKWFYSH